MMRERWRKRAGRTVLAAAVAGTLLMGAAGPRAEAAAGASINWTDVKQSIDGIGASQAGWSNAVYDLPEPQRSQVMDLLFRQDSGIGLSILRGAVFSDYSAAPGQYSFGLHPDQAWVMQQAKARGVDKIVASAWSPPAYMKTNGQTTNGGYLKQENYGDFAALLSQFVKQYKALYNIDMYGVSVANEPNSMTFLSWDSSQWNSTNFQVFLKDHLKQAMVAAGVQNTKVIVGESSWWSEDLVKDSLNDPLSAERLDIVAGHNYPVPVVNAELPSDPFATAQSKGKKVWMTEVSKVDGYDPGMGSGLKFAKQLHTFMTKTGVNAWLYWTGAIPGDNDEGLINVDLAAGTYKLTKRYYTIGNYSKFIRPGYVRIGMPDSPQSGLYTSAYKDPATGKFVIVAVNDSDATAELNLTPAGFSAGSITPFTTNDSLSLAKGQAIPLSGGQYQTRIPAKSVVTFTGQNGSPAPAVTTVTDELNDWSKTFAHTAGLAFDSTNAIYYNGDASRVKRTAGTTESLVYRLPGMTGFNASLYQFSIWDGVAFYFSSDGVSWTPVVHVSTPGVYTGSKWYGKQYSAQSLLPAGTQYLKVELSGADSWEKQISRIVLTASS
ncbi:glycoside hydrolase family 30 protein [Paenibacillus humicus]|uniref:glycoside hydrolase family 30 protein n=1 Tax=Paenibacillus humicus TaxID=412861 RepID=UPI003F16B176